MNDDDLENMFERIDGTPVPGAQARALQAALREFDAVQEENKKAAATQGIAGHARLTSEPQSLGRKIMQQVTGNNSGMRWLYSGMAGAAVLVLGVFIAVQMPTRHGGGDFRVDEGLDDFAQYNKIAHQGQYQLLEESALGDVQMQSSAGIVAPAAPQRELFSMNMALDAAKAVVNPALPAAVNIAAESSATMRHAADTDGGRVDYYQDVGRDRFESADANPVIRVSAEPVSTFSIDVDTASYSFVRRQLNAGVLPQKAAVRLEEMVNYFPYDYPLPTDRSAPFSTHVTVLDSPWRAGNKLVHIGIQGYELQGEQPRSNLVFLLDVSGSMDSPDKLPLVKQSMGLLLDRLQPEDSVAIVVYAGAAGTVLEPTAAKDKQKILAALNRLQAGGSTAGAAGIQLAYQLAESQFIEDGVNRIVLATDGDFNVGINSVEELEGFVERKRESGVFLSVLGFGEGNYHDALMQSLAQNGNGIAAYIDTLGEAQKVLVDEATSALFPIAGDVKIQVEFNPATVSEYRLLGYETRMLAEEDFNNDAVDAGDIGAGHSVTAIYEITPVGSDSGVFSESRYAETPAGDGAAGEYGFLKLRYKLPDGDKSRLLTQPISTRTAATATVQREARFATAVAGFAELLKGGKYTAGWTYADALAMARANRGDDPFGYRAEFIQLVRKAEMADAL